MRFLFGLVALLCPAVSNGSDFYLHDGDTVVFYGDSITNQRLYSVFTETYVLTRFPEIQVRFVHSGFSGDRVSGGQGGTIDERLARDVFAYHPTVVTVMLGMNDGEYRAYDPAIFEKYASGYRYIVKRLKSELPMVRITLLEPSPYDDVTRPPAFAGGYNAVLLRFGDFVRSLARKENLNVVDMNAPAVKVLSAINNLNQEVAADLIPDRVHPSTGIHMIMAESLLKAWHAPSLVTAVEIDGAEAVLRKAENTTVDALRFENGISWTQMDRALPMPLDQPDDLITWAVRCSDFTEVLNQELLKVSNLVEGSYVLRIDDQTIGTFDAVTLAQGINLATLSTPMSAQAQKVLDLTYRHNHLHFARLRMVEDALKPFPLTKVKTAVDALDNLEDEVIALQRETAIPKPHRYELTKRR